MELKQLYEKGILTKEEMEAEKTKIFNVSAPKEESINKNVSLNDESVSWGRFFALQSGRAERL